MQSIESLGRLKVAAAQRPREGAFWRTELAALPERAGFPADHVPAGTGSPGVRAPAAPDDDASAAAPAPDGRGSGGVAVVARELDPSLAGRLLKLARGRDAALHAVLVAAAGALLQRYTGEDEVVLAVPALPVAGGPPPLAATLPLRLPIGDDRTLRSLLGEVATRLRAAAEHQDYPIELLARDSGSTPHDGDDPFAAVLVDTVHDNTVHDSADHAANGSPGDAAEGGGRPGFPVVFSFARQAGRLTLRLRYRPAVHTPGTARRLLVHCMLLLDQAGAHPDTELGALDLRSVADRALSAGANATDVAFDGPGRLDELFDRRVAATPDAVALVGDGFRLTYAELGARVNRLAHTLRARGVGRDDLVAVLADRSPEMFTAIHAVVRAGGAYLPIDPGNPRERIVYLLRDSGARLVLTQPHLAGAIAGTGVATLDLTDEAAYAPDSSPPPVLGDGGDLAYVIYTSGSTGEPKGVQIEHRAAVNRIAWMERAYPIDAADVIMQKTPTSFDVSVWELFWGVLAGSAVCLPAPGAERDPEALVAAVRRYGVTTMHFVPPMLDAFLDFVSGAQEGPGPLRQVFASGEALAPHHVRRFHEVMPSARLVNLYGPTEATVDVTHYQCRGDETRVPIGWPVANTRVHVLDAGLRPQPVGVPGELCIAGVQLARGYLGRPELTAERFTAAPHAGEERVYRTGDRAVRRTDGSVEFLGRMDHQLKVRGYRVEPGEIEERLRRHPSVRDAVVVAREPDGLRGYVVSAAPVPEDELKEHLRRSLPAYMVPARLVTLERWPLTPNGKLDRRALPEPAEGSVYEAPRTPVEADLARVWAEVLGAERVGVHDNFFALGGDSIRFVTVLARARALGLDFTFRQLFENPTVARLAEVAGESTGSGTGSGTDRELRPFELLRPEDLAKIPDGVVDAYPMTQLQAGLVFQSELSHGTVEYHDIISYTIQSTFDAERFEEAARILAARHPIFRTGYHLTGYTESLQLVHADAPSPLTVADLRGMTESEQEAWHRDWLEREKAHRFVWAEPGLVRLHVHVLADDLFRYTLSQHNSALDGWSITLVHTTLFDLYHRLLEGRPLPDAPAGNHVRDYVALERRSLADPEHRAHWAEVLSDGVFTELPRTRSAAAPDVFPVVFHEVELPAGLSDRIVALAERLSVPVKNVALAAHVKVISLISGEPDVITGYEHSGRPENEGATEAIGLFLNTVPFRARMEPGSWAGLVRQVYRSEVELLPARRYPMAQMKHDLETQDPLFETAFNFTHFYLLRQLEEREGFALLDVRANSETEFVVRAEFSRHFATDEVRLSLHYHAHLFEPWQVARMGAYYRAAFEAMTADPDAPHHLADLLPGEESAALDAAEESEDLPAEVAGLLPGPARLRFVDAHGLRVPFATPGRAVLVTAGDESVTVGTGLHGRRLPGRVELVPEPERRRFRRSAGRSVPRSGGRPEGALQQRIAKAWAGVLDVPAESITLGDNFFELGGGSLSAMRVVMEMGGLVTLTDLMRNSTFGPLCAVAEANLEAQAERDAPPRPRRLLRPLTDDPGRAACALVCFPYAGGDAANFEPLATALAEGGVAVYGVDLPGHDAGRPDEPFVSVREAARLVADEIRATVGLPVLLWGHCVGSAPAVETARLMEAAGDPPRHVVVAGKLLHDAGTTRESVRQAEAMTDDEVVAWLADVTGLTGLDALDPAQAAFVAGVFRHDSRAANTYLLEQQGAAPLGVPLTTVYAADDPLTPGYARRHTEWSRFAATIRLAEIGPAGHYFCRTAPDAVAALVRTLWKEGL
ncbi:amino acid adenylation domain-containing protein [Nonomuraea sp. KC401]|uniref:non-ribosomal peptide synthetase n=1 Tax=unclassified Nonomuraea TaxID=2593643 RepID=UPI0010FDDD40|nr:MULTISPECIES: non-ribosomal peptide synthetase [unclassified Nonomuraea]NBE99427.1 amino acid adenylation domain-containing protein [Nonomuraea sp. K271]TLF57389.1 amino acid adenylation domain-containing protein [Nonomuraea sp. KC401]